MNATSALSQLGRVLALVLVFTGSHVFAQSPIVQTQSFSNAGPGTTPYTFNKFDSSLGTLTGVTIELSGISTAGSATIYNTSGYPVIFGGSGGPGYNEDLTGGFTNTFVATSSTSGSDSMTVVVTSNTQTQLSVPPGTSPTYAGNNFTTGTLNGTQSPSPADFSAGDLANYIGSGTGTITISLNSSTTVIASGNAGSNQVYVAGNASALASGNVNLIYSYTPVPEPSKTAAAMIGFTLVILVGRKYFKGRSLAFA